MPRTASGRCIVPDNIPDALRRKEERESNHRHWWAELAACAKRNDVVAFFKLYAEYLEFSGIISRERALVHQMAKAVSAIPEVQNLAGLEVQSTALQP